MSDFPIRILHAEDDVLIHDIVSEALHRYKGVNIKHCNNGQEMINCARSFNPEMILLDLNMPCVNGPDALEVMRKENPDMDIPIIFVTGYRDVKMCPEYEKLGVIGVLHKPLSVGTFPERIRHFWQEHQKNKSALQKSA